MKKRYIILIVFIIGLLLIGLGVYFGFIKIDTNQELSLEEKYSEILKGNMDFYEVTEKSSDFKKDIHSIVKKKNYSVKYASIDIDEDKKDEFIIIGDSKVLFLTEYEGEIRGYPIPKEDITMFKKDGSMYCHGINQICRLEFEENVFNYKPLIDHFEQELTEEQVSALLEEFNQKEELHFKTYKK